MSIHPGQAKHVIELLENVLVHPSWHLSDRSAVREIVEFLKQPAKMVRPSVDTTECVDILQGFIDHPWWKGLDRDALRAVVDGLKAQRLTILPTQPSFAIPGEDIIFSARGGWDYQVTYAKTILTEGAEYRVEALNVGRSSSTYTLSGIEGRWNTSMFDFADPDAVLWEGDEARKARDDVILRNYDYIHVPMGEYEKLES